MSENIMDILRNRGFIKQTVNEDALYKLLGSESVTFYIGFDPTADSLHVGHFLALMAMSHMQKAGHKPIILVGGGTAMVGDPSGRSDMRSMMSREIIGHNVECFKKQMSKFLSFTGDNAAVIVNNADWLLSLNYVEFLRDVGAHFSVNRMLTADCFKSRMEKGLSFLEFNYMLMQAYDYLVLHNKYNCRLQCGGDDQWSNILAGADLIRRKNSCEAYAMTFTLLLTSQGTKMGKTASGAVWLDREKTSPYEFYQYWRNVDDNDVESCLKFLTYVSLDEIHSLCEHKDERINKAKERLAYEVTAIVHSIQDAQKAASEVKAAFSGDTDNMPSFDVDYSINNIVDLLLAINIAPSKGEAKRLIAGGGIMINDKKVSEFTREISDIEKQEGIVVHKGKKTHIKVNFI